MAIYAIGDIHGCDRTFLALLKKIHFHPDNDHIYLVGDVINRGPRSVDILQRLIDHQMCMHMVLGNHDLSFLVYCSNPQLFGKRQDTFAKLFTHPESKNFIQYLLKQPLMRLHQEDNQIFTIAHAGIHPMWTNEAAQQYSDEISHQLSLPNAYHFLQQLFGNTPARWQDDLSGIDRWRCIVNIFTRMRALHHDQTLDFDFKDTLDKMPSHLSSWFNHTLTTQSTIIFGHWATLGVHLHPQAICIDSGCSWKGILTAIRLDDPQLPVHQVEYAD